MLLVQGNDVLATAKQAVAGMGSLFGSASKKLDWIGSSIDKKAQELLPKLASSPKERGNAVEEFSSSKSPESLLSKGAGEATRHRDQESSLKSLGSKPRQGLRHEPSDWDWGEEELLEDRSTR